MESDIKVFVCYADEDYHIAERLYNDLKKRVCPTFYTIH